MLSLQCQKTKIENIITTIKNKYDMKTIKFFMVALISLVTATTCFADDRMILPEQLPAAAKTFIQTHYSGAKILFASKDLDGLSKHYEVHLNDGTQLDFDSKGNQITGYHGDSRKLCIPDYVMQTDGTFWYTSNVYSIADEAFAGKDFVSAFFRGNLGDGTGARILKDNPELKDIWFNMQVLYDAEKDTYSKEAFAGIPEDVTVHLPASLTDEQRSKVEDFLHGIGIPAGAAFEYYDLRQGGAAAEQGR